MPRSLRFAAALAALVIAAPLAAQPLVYVTDPAKDALTAINSGTNTIVRTVPALSAAGAIAISPDGKRVYVAAAGTGDNGSVAIIDGSKITNPNENPVIHRLAVGGMPVAVAYDAANNLLYVADATNKEAAAYDLDDVNYDNPDPVATYLASSGLVAMVLAPDGKTLALASTATPSVTLYSLRAIAAGQTGLSLVILGSTPRALAWSAGGDKLWIATAAGFSVYTPATGDVAAVDLPQGSDSVAVAPRAGKIYFGADSGDLVYAYQPDQGLVNTLAVGNGPINGLSLSADGTRLYAVRNCSDCGIAVVATSTGQVIAQTLFGIAPETAGDFAGPGDIYAPNATTEGQVAKQLSGSVTASDYSSRALSYVLLLEPADGTINFNATGDYLYTPPSGYSGVQSFVWEASATSGDGSPIDPVSRPITQTMEILPTVSAIGDQQADPDSTLGPLTFTIAGTKPFTIKLKSSNSDLVSTDQITVSSGCGDSSLSCSLTIPVKNVDNGNTDITLTAIGPDGLTAKTIFRISVGNGSNDGGGAFAPFALGGLGLLILLALGRRRHRQHDRV